MLAAKAATNYLKAVYERVSAGYNLHFTRITFDTKINKFTDLPTWEQGNSNKLRKYI